MAVLAGKDYRTTISTDKTCEEQSLRRFFWHEKLVCCYTYIAQTLYVTSNNIFFCLFLFLVDSSILGTLWTTHLTERTWLEKVKRHHSKMQWIE